MEFGKKDLRTDDKLTLRGEEGKYIVKLKTSDGDLIINETHVGWDKLIEYNNDLTNNEHKNLDIVKVERPVKAYEPNGALETIYEREEKLPYNAWYRFKGGRHPYHMAFYTDKNTAFGFSGKDVWNDLSNDWDELDSHYHEPVPTEEWQARLIPYAKEKGYKNGNYKCLSDPEDTSRVNDESNS